MARIKRRSKSSNTTSSSRQTFHMNLDSHMIESLLRYVVAECVTTSELNNLRKLLERIDLEDFKFSQAKYNNIRLVKYISEAKSTGSLEDTGAICSYVIDKCPELSEALETVNWDKNQMSPVDARQISRSISEKLQYSIIMSMEDEIVSLYDKLRNCGFYSMSEYTKTLREVLTRGLTSMQKTAISSGMVDEIDFSSVDGIDTLRTIVERAHRPGAVLSTGIKALNAILSPGFQSGRLYTFLGLTGGFKSGMLLNLADEIRQCNPRILDQNEDKQKTILFITMENSINETVGRLYDMYSDENADIATDPYEKVVEVLHKEAGYTFGASFIDKDGNDISKENAKKHISIHFVYKANLSITTGDLYTMIQSLEDQGKEVICVILDYIKRIDSVNDWYGDERIRLANVAQELKSLAEYFQIPVITAQQVNREGNAIVDAAMRENKQDVLQFVGSANIGSSWAIAEESDWMAILNRERQKGTNQLYLTVKRVKIRGKSDPKALDYFNHPFTNEKCIRLEMDYDKPFSVSKRSLASTLEAVSTDDPFENDHSRPSIHDIKDPRKKAKLAMQKAGLEEIGDMEL